MKASISSIKGPFSSWHHVSHSLPSGGINTLVTFPPGSLTKSELDYCRLVSHADFFQLVRTAVYMNEGLTFREATIKYLKKKI